ncbi:MAG: 3-deoxy-D-manno-octulosonic acid transferase [Pirellulales bacterium]|nr:3-deoxy-D-manno-octulosonic acid transferase [Pirellulales bacterium]
MAWLFNIAYLLLLIVISPWLLYRSWRTGRYRRGWAEKLLGHAPKLTRDRFRIWFHAVSVGEVNLLAPLLEGIARERPEWECVISTTTDTGYELAREKYSEHTVFYAPLDFTWAVDRALANIAPDLLVLAELELWPNLIRRAAGGDVKVAVVNARLSEKSFRGYRRLGWLMRSVLQQLDGIAAQNMDYAKRFELLGIPTERIHTTGSIKFDNAQTDRENERTRRMRTLAGIDNSEKVFLAGSTQAPEEALAIGVYKQLHDAHPDLRLILVPRHPERFDTVARLLNESGLLWKRRSQFDDLTADNDSAHAGKPVLLIDTVGELGAWWGVAYIAFVGGSMGTRGGQNMIEPAAYGAAVSFGPKTKNFRDVVEMMKQEDCATVVHDQQEMTEFVRECLTNPVKTGEMEERAKRLVIAQQGATQQTIQFLLAIAGSVQIRQREAA